MGHNKYADSVPIQIRIEDEAMFISNNCVLPRDWTVDTLMQPHKSMPFNPSIANAFYRAGYIEAWGRGIQKIFDECKEHGIPDPDYKLLGDDLTVSFKASKQVSKPHPKHQNEALDEALGNKILCEIMKNSTIRQDDLAQVLGISRASVQRAIYLLKDKKKISRVGGKRFGHWEIL